MSAMIARARENRPPAPRPCSARKAASWYIDCDRPDSTEPTTKIVMADRNSGRRP